MTIVVLLPGRGPGFVMLALLGAHTLSHRLRKLFPPS